MTNKLKSSSWETSPYDSFALTPIDGRNKHKLVTLQAFFSEYALNHKRVFIEIEFLIALSQSGIAPKLNPGQIKSLRTAVAGFSANDARQIRVLEQKTNHDMKAIELYCVSKLKDLDLSRWSNFIHYTLTSEDVNNLAYSLLCRDFIGQVLIPQINQLQTEMKQLIHKSHYPMMGRTHGQPAHVTSLSKELAVFYERFRQEISHLNALPWYGKLNGAVGSYADQALTHPEIDWDTLSANFIQQLGLLPYPVTTQILPYDPLLKVFSSLTLLHSIAVSLCQNLWDYVSRSYFVQTSPRDEVGSSTMPQKVNPIYLEGAEGGFGLSNALFNHYVQKLPHSRLQRDLSDSTIRRSFGIAFSYSYLSWQSLIEALGRLSPNPSVLEAELNEHWEILTSTIQNRLRLLNVKDPYTKIRQSVQGKSLTRQDFIALINQLGISAKDAGYLKNITFAMAAAPAIQIAKKVVKL